MSDQEIERLVLPATHLASIDYPLAFYRRMAPVHLNYACALNGRSAPDLDAGFTYCELGCGTGATVTVLADADPRGRFVGIDVSESHVEAARALAEAGGVDNVEFVLADLERYDPAELPDFDYIAMHGLWTWVTPDVRRAILRFLERKLKPGGLVYVSYNSLPGWSGSTPIRRYFLERAATIPGPLHDKIPGIVAELGGLLENDAVYFKENALARRVLKPLLEAEPGYIAHEYLAPGWAPEYFSAVNREMASAGLGYVGHAPVLENLLELSTPRQFVPALRAIEDEPQREFVRDFIVNRMFRSDVYQRPGAASSAARGGLGGTLFGMLPAPPLVKSEIDVWSGAIDVGGPVFERLCELLASNAMTLDEIRADAEIAKAPDEMLVQTVLALSASEQLAPFARGGATPPDLADGPVRLPSALNRELLARPRSDTTPLSSPVAGTGVELAPLEALLLAAATRDDPAGWMWADMQRRGARMSSGGSPLETEQDNVAAVRRAVDEFRATRLPKLAHLGLVEPRT